MDTISREDFIAAIEAGIAVARRQPGFTEDYAEALREHGRTAINTLIGGYWDDEDHHCPAYVVLDGDYAPCEWDLSFATTFDDHFPDTSGAFLVV